MVTRTGMLMVARFRASEIERGGYHVGRQTVREGGLPDLPYY